jgi:GT2 family glycosyltransferase
MKSIIITTYNSAGYIQKCLQSVEENITFLDEVFVIDNNSSDDTQNLISNFIENKKNYFFIKNDKNLGFAKAVNAGIEMSKGEHIFLINPDIEFEKEVLDKMIDLSEKNSADISGAGQLNEKGNYLGSFGKFPGKSSNFFESIRLAKIFPVGRYFRYNLLTQKKFKSNRKADWVGGGFMLIKKKVIEKIGNFDENFFMYFEDVDFCKRAKESGFSIWHLGEVEVLHYGGKSFSDKNKNNRNEYNENSLKYFMQKNNL